MAPDGVQVRSLSYAHKGLSDYRKTEKLCLFNWEALPYNLTIQKREGAMFKPIFRLRRDAGQARRWGRAGLFFVIVPWGATWATTAGAQCPQAMPAVSLWSDRESSIREQERLPEACLKSLVRQCDAEAEAGFMDGGNAATCSLRYEALLRYGFRGNFTDLLRWWQDSSRVAIQ